jgi:hypothetical protein
MGEKVRRGGVAAAGVVAGSVSTGMMGTALGIVPPEVGAPVEAGAAVVAVVGWLVARLATEVFWLRALSRPAAAARRIVGDGEPSARTVRVLELTLAAQREVVRARGGSARRPE